MAFRFGRKLLGASAGRAMFGASKAQIRGYCQEVASIPTVPKRRGGGGAKFCFSGAAVAIIFWHLTLGREIKRVEKENELARKAFIGAPSQFRRYSQQVLSTDKEEGGSKVVLFFLGSFAGSLVYMFWGFRQQAKIDKFRADLNVDMWAETYWQFHNLGKRKQSPNE